MPVAKVLPAPTESPTRCCRCHQHEQKGPSQCISLQLANWAFTKLQECSFSGHNLCAHSAYMLLQVTSLATDRPKPVYKSTACQLGIHMTTKVWPLIGMFVASQSCCVLLQVTSAATDRPKPVYKSTACQLGIHKTAGVWPLIDSLLPSTNTSALVRRWFRRLLLLPPPTAVAKSVSSACSFLAGG